MKINDSEFIIYDLDTVVTVMDRIASGMNTLPKYLYFPKGILTEDDIKGNSDNNDIVVIDILEIIRKLADTTTDFSVFHKEIENMLEQQYMDMERDILVPFIVLSGNKKGFLSYPAEFVSLALQTTQETVNLFFSEPIPNTEKIWKNREELKETLWKSISKNKEKVAKQVGILMKFDKIKTGVGYTNFVLEKMTFNLRLNTEDTSLLGIFNGIRLNSLVPFASCDGFYKILNDFTPIPEWIVSSPEGILMKVAEKSQPRIQDYKDIAIVAESEDEIVASLDLDTFSENITKDELIQRFISTLDKNISVGDTKETKVNGVFFFPDLYLDTYVFLDMVMLNPIFSSIISVDESEKTTRKRSSVYMHFTIPKIGQLSAYITDKIVDYSDPVMRGMSRELFKEKDDYVMVTIGKATSVSHVKAFQAIFSRLLVVYQEEYKDIVKIYRQYIPTFGDQKLTASSTPTQRKKTLKEIAPEIFISTYSRKCGQPPEIISDAEAEIAIRDGKRVMTFPKDNSITIPRKYICDNDKYPNHIYPGIRENTLGNKDKFPYIPCCYTKDQSEIKGSKYRHYFFGERLEIKDDRQQDLIKTNKFVPQDNFGTLPADLEELFKTIDPDPDYKYQRRGVLRCVDSFLYCIAETAGDTNSVNFPEMPDDEREEYIGWLRKTLLTDPKYIAACKQEMYDIPDEEIRKILLSEDRYIEPQLFLHALECYYKCNIFIFTRHQNSGELIVPRHSQVYYKSLNKYPCVFILEHMGSEANQALYPQCEIISKWNINDETDIEYIFDSDTAISIGITNLFRQLSGGYTLSGVIENIYIPKRLKVVAQIVDLYGKTRVIKISSGDIEFLVYTDPMQPLAAPQFGITSDNLTRYALTEILPVLTQLDISVLDQNIQSDFVVELSVLFSNGLTGKIPVHDSNLIGGVPVYDSIPEYIIPQDRSEIKRFADSKRMARYLVEYIYWYYSVFITEKDIDKMSQKSIEKFISEKIIIDPEFRYGKVSKYFDTKSGFMKDSKLVLSSNEILKRLIYMLTLSIHRNPEKIKEYHNRKIIEKYYMDITDFDQNNSQVLLEGNSTVEKWINKKSSIYRINNTVLPYNKDPYFFLNKNIDPEKVFLAQNIGSVMDAQNIGIEWYKDGYNNLGDSDIKISEKYRYTLYAIKSQDRIDKHSIPGIETDIPLDIVGYKIEDEPHFTVLLLEKMNL